MRSFREATRSNVARLCGGVFLIVLACVLQRTIGTRAAHGFVHVVHIEPDAETPTCTMTILCHLDDEIHLDHRLPLSRSISGFERLVACAAESDSVTFVGIRPGDYQLSSQRADTNRILTEEFHVDASGSDRTIDMRPRRQVTLRGTIEVRSRDEAEPPQRVADRAKLSSRCVRIDMDRHHDAAVDARGRYEFERVPVRPGESLMLRVRDAYEHDLEFAPVLVAIPEDASVIEVPPFEGWLEPDPENGIVGGNATQGDTDSLEEGTVDSPWQVDSYIASSFGGMPVTDPTVDKSMLVARGDADWSDPAAPEGGVVIELFDSRGRVLVPPTLPIFIRGAGPHDRKFEASVGNTNRVRFPRTFDASGRWTLDVQRAGFYAAMVTVDIELPISPVVTMALPIQLRTVTFRSARALDLREPEGDTFCSVGSDH